TLATTTGRIVSGLRSVWQGTDSNTFVQQTWPAAKKQMTSLQQAIEELALKLDQQIEAQLQASAATGMSGSGGGGVSTYDPNDPAQVADEMERRLREEGLLTDDDPGQLYEEWLLNAAKRGVDIEEIIAIARDHGITPEDFAVLEGMEKCPDPDGKTFFLLPEGISAADAQKAVLMAYIYNAGTDYDAADDAGNKQNSGGSANDYTETPYSSAEIQRIIDRQEANSWSYTQDVAFVQGNGGQLVATPNGMLMGLGGNWVQDQFSMQGGTTWGDIFMMNVDDPADPAATLKAVVAQGTNVNTSGGAGSIDLDRLLHHEEIHSQQWAEDGYAGFGLGYLWNEITGKSGADNPYEQDAGLYDGGYK
ncbi:MAG: hypothetical protein LBR19_03380, partial [Bifidobacteriaceae bacterium]|nr:hypothetical protein [Bifidobacteriaceae bacterium]